MGIKTLGTVVRANTKDVGALQAIGNISQKRNIQEYQAVNVENFLVSVGSVRTEAMQMSVIYNPSDSAGAKELENAFNSGATIAFEIELSDKPEAGTNGTKFSWDEAVVSDFNLEPQKDGFVVASFSVYLNGKPTVTAAA